MHLVLAVIVFTALFGLSSHGVQGMQGGTVYRTNGDGLTTVCTECSNHEQRTLLPTAYAAVAGGEQRVINPPSLTFNTAFVSAATHERAANNQPLTGPVTTYTTTTYYTDSRRRDGDGHHPAAACSRCAEDAANVGTRSGPVYYSTANGARVVNRQYDADTDGYDDDSNYHTTTING